MTRPAMTRHGRIVGVLLAAALALAGCQPLPRPFQPDAGDPANPLTAPPSGRVVAVPEIPGAPAALRGKVAAALRTAEIPATTEPGHHDSYVLEGAMTEERLGEKAVEVVFLWTLKTGEGAAIGRFAQHIVVSQERWAAAEAGVLTAIADNAARQTAGYIQEPAPKEAPPPSKPPILLGTIDGAPGDGETALSSAIRVALRRAAVPLAEKPGDGVFELRARVSVTRQTAATDRVALHWSLHDPGGKEIGVISQENLVPTGRLDGPWRDLALAMADGASEGLLALIDAAAGR